LCANRERIVHSFHIVLRIIGVGCTRSSENWGQERTCVTQSLSNASWESNDFSIFAGSLEEVLYVWSKSVWPGHENYIMFFCGAQCVEVEVIYHKGIAICGKVDIEFKKE
jgi:hypothetical protein